MFLLFYYHIFSTRRNPVEKELAAALVLLRVGIPHQYKIKLLHLNNKIYKSRLSILT